jgi:hypothetical protein
MAGSMENRFTHAAEDHKALARHLTRYHNRLLVA